MSLTQVQTEFFNVCGSRPHVSLAKPTHWHWQGVVEFVATCQKESDWTVSPADPNLMFSKQLSAYKKTFLSTMHCQRTVELVPTTESHFEACSLSVTDLSSLPMLAEVPTDLWAKGKNDVGLIKRCEPVIINPKSDYRPCKKQYPVTLSFTVP